MARRTVKQVDWDRLLTVAEAAELLKITPVGARKLCDRGVLRAKRFGRDWIVDRSSVEARARERGVTGEEPE